MKCPRLLHQVPAVHVNNDTVRTCFLAKKRGMSVPGGRIRLTATTIQLLGHMQCTVHSFMDTLLRPSKAVLSELSTGRRQFCSSCVLFGSLSATVTGWYGS